MQTMINVVIGDGRIVTVEARVEYKGTRTPTHSMGDRNIEDYDVGCMGIACQGTWDGDGRRNILVEDCPPDLVVLLEPIYREQDAERCRREARVAAAAERRFYGRVISPELRGL